MTNYETETITQSISRQYGKDFEITYDYLQKHSRPILRIWSYDNGKIYKLSHDKPKHVTVKRHGKKIKLNTNPNKWIKLIYQPFGTQIHLKMNGVSKEYRLKQSK